MAREISVRALADLLRAGTPAYLLDVRQPWEHQIAALPGSQLIPLGQLAVRSAEVQAPEGCTLVVYCHHGVRSQAGADLLERLGFANVFSLAGGIDAWSCEVDPSVPRY
jgi:adenylyltransferase/sulfurtransferase